MLYRDAIRYELVDLMDKRGVTGTKLADALGVSAQAVSKWRDSGVTGTKRFRLSHVLYT